MTERARRQDSWETIFPYLLLVLTNLFWSFNFIIGKVVVEAIPPATISFFRWFLPALLLLFWNRKSIKAHLPLLRANIPLLLVLGLTGYAVNSICVYAAVRSTSVINAAFINAFNPVLIALAGLALYRFPITIAQTAGFLVALYGVMTIIFAGQIRNIFLIEANKGDLFMLGSIISWAFHTIIYKKKGTEFPYAVLFTTMMVSGLMITLPFVLLENYTGGIAWLNQIRWRHILGIFALNIFPSVLAYLFWNQALQRISANQVAITQYLLPLFTTGIAITLLGEKLHGFHLVGGFLIFLGVFLVTLPLPRQKV